jgi:hypothetical protein
MGKQTFIFCLTFIGLAFGNDIHSTQITGNQNYVITSYHDSMVVYCNQLMDTTKGLTESDLTRLAYSFERLSEVYIDEWLPYYYASLCWTNIAGNFSKEKDVDKLADRAVSLLDKADKLTENKSDILCLSAFIISSRIRVDILKRGRSYTEESNVLLMKTLEINSENPIAYYVLGKNKLNMPIFFGGGKEKAKPYFLKASELYKRNKLQKNSIEPAWGKTATKMILLNTYKN